jgi:hypothetical protein
MIKALAKRLLKKAGDEATQIPKKHVNVNSSIQARFPQSPLVCFVQSSMTEKACLALGLALSFWYGWILDDAYIYFRYVDNLVIHDLGLVFNRGEYVEGFSSPAWAAVLILFRFLYLNYWLVVRLFGLLGYLLFWYLAVQVNGALIRSKEYSIVINLPLLYLTCTYGVTAYFTSGMESPLVLLMAAAYAAFFTFPSSRWLCSAVALSPLVRHELLLPFSLAFVWLWVQKKRFPSMLFLLCLLSLGGCVLLRIWYYADFFPNTFYLKDDVWIPQGIAYLYDTVLAYDVVPLAGLMLIIYAWLRKRYGVEYVEGKVRTMMLLTAAPVVVYVIKIGGAAQHFRYLAFPFCLCVFACGGLIEMLLYPLAQRHTRMIGGAILFVGLLFLSNYPRQLQQHPIFRSHAGYVCNNFLRISDSASHRFDGSRVTPDITSILPQDLSYSAAARRFNTERWHLFHYYWCQHAFLDARSLVIHSLGLTEPFLARMVMPPNSPGHRWGLDEPAKDLVALRSRYFFRKGAFAAALKDGTATEWMKNNIATIKNIENKVYNRHDFFENLRLAFITTGKIFP